MNTASRQFCWLTQALLIGLLGAAHVGADESSHVAAEVKEIFRSRCFECHGGTATQAGVSILNAASLRENENVAVKTPEDSQLVQLLLETDEDVRMPLGSPALSHSNIDLVKQWIAAGAPDFPEDVASPNMDSSSGNSGRQWDPNYVLQQILQHQRSLPSSERFHFRYFSSHHQLVAGATALELTRQKMALIKSLNHLSYEPGLVQPEVINPGLETVFAVDLRKVGWHRAAATSDDGDTINSYDLILLDYPYGIALEDSEVFTRITTEYVLPSEMVRPIPFVRIDWFVSRATQPPLYHDMLKLPQTVNQLEDQLGVDSEENLKLRIARRAGMAVSGVSQNNRAVERHPSNHGAYWKSIDYATSKGTENIFSDPVNLHGVGGEMIFNLPNGLQGYFIADGAGGRLDLAPTSIVTDKFAEDKTVRNGLSCIRCHQRGLKDFEDDIRPAVEKIQGSGLIDKRATLELYAEHQEMNVLVATDTKRFLKAIDACLGDEQVEEPITSVSQRFLEAPMQLSTVAGELGLVHTDELKILVRQPQLTGLGMVALADAGVIRRDMWEDYFDQVVRSLGLGIPLVPIDGISLRTYIPNTSEIHVTLQTESGKQVFVPGEEVAFVIKNKGSRPVFVELLGRSARGRMVRILDSDTRIEGGQRHRFPSEGTLEIQPKLGHEEVILYASETPFESATIFRGKNVADRAIHGFYQIGASHPWAIKHDAGEIVKRTLRIETR